MPAMIVRLTSASKALPVPVSGDGASTRSEILLAALLVFRSSVIDLLGVFTPWHVAIKLPLSHATDENVTPPGVSPFSGSASCQPPTVCVPTFLPLTARSMVVPEE